MSSSISLRRTSKNPPSPITPAYNPPMHVYLSLGANLGNKEATLCEAIRLLNTEVGNVVRRSNFYYSEPWGFESAHRFCNICVLIDTSLSPIDLLHKTQAIERQLGRTQKSTDGVYHDRTIDIDILTYEGISLTTDELTLPHPKMNEREFVRIPLAEIL